MTAAYDFSSKDIELEAKFDPVTVKVTKGNTIGLSFSSSKTFSV